MEPTLQRAATTIHHHPPSTTSMKTLTSASLLLLLCALYPTSATRASNTPDLCCFRFYDGRIPLAQVVSFNRTDSGCPTEAVIFLTRKHKQICMEASNKWAMNIINQLSKNSTIKETQN
ncbi:C-C motif chemokine 4 homolog [Amia ocellicauda]|uniref:C-C motif chemokine 4 homolog n=1 Tax=Amia ocellicauda TaxID=2972642 RepID=UPI0034640065